MARQLDRCTFLLRKWKATCKNSDRSNPIHMISFFSWIFFGIIVGALAKFLMPGKDPGGIFITMILGIAGAVFGGWMGSIFGFGRQGESAGWLLSILGAVTILAIYRFMFNLNRI